jgi:uncharacterized protein
MKIIIDTNCLIPSIPRKNPEYWLYEAFRDKKFDWVISNEILLEYEEQLTKFYNSRTAEIVINIFLTAPNVIFAEPFIRWNLITADPDDNKFADLAISTNAQYLVTNDRHFNVLRKLPFPTVNVISLKKFQLKMGY